MSLAIMILKELLLVRIADGLDVTVFIAPWTLACRLAHLICSVMYLIFYSSPIIRLLKLWTIVIGEQPNMTEPPPHHLSAV